MEIPKPSEDDKQFFRSLIADDPEVEIKPMFGNLGAFVHGNMFAGLFGSAVGVRLADPDACELEAIDGIRARSARTGTRWPATSACPRPGGGRLPGRELGGQGPGPRRRAAAQGQEAEETLIHGPGSATVKAIGAAMR